MTFIKQPQLGIFGLFNSAYETQLPQFTFLQKKKKNVENKEDICSVTQQSFEWAMWAENENRHYRRDACDLSYVFLAM